MLHSEFPRIEIVPGRTLNFCDCCRMTEHEDSKPRSQRPDGAEFQRPISASALFQGRHEVLIEHESEIYRLMLTRNNKLLLQK